MIRRAASSRIASRRGFTLVELLITVSIIALMASMVLFAMFQAQDAARAQKTRTLIAKLNNIIMTRYDEYRTRRVPINFTAAERANPRLMATMRMEALRDLMRMEMPDRWSDVLQPPVAPLYRPSTDKIQPPSVFLAYQAKWEAVTGQAPTGSYQYAYDMTKDEYQGAECLYLLVMETLAQQGDARDVFKATDSADVDGDGFREFVDAWGTPIRFLRWAPGFTSELQVRGVDTATAPATAGQTVEVTFGGAKFSAVAGSYVGGALAVLDADGHIISGKTAQITGYRHTGANAIFICSTPPTAPVQPFPDGVPSTGDSVAILHPDQFDQRRVYPDYFGPNSATQTATFATYPLIYSAGPDKSFGVTSDYSMRLEYATTARLYPCFVPTSGTDMIGTQVSSSSERPNAWLDNITNHQPNAR